jgi:hypothetical protein
MTETSMAREATATRVSCDISTSLYQTSDSVVDLIKTHCNLIEQNINDISRIDASVQDIEKRLI